MIEPLCNVCRSPLEMFRGEPGIGNYLFCPACMARTKVAAGDAPRPCPECGSPARWSAEGTHVITQCPKTCSFRCERIHPDTWDYLIDLRLLPCPYCGEPGIKVFDGDRAPSAGCVKWDQDGGYCAASEGLVDPDEWNTRVGLSTSGWISVKDALPNLNGNVLALAPLRLSIAPGAGDIQISRIFIFLDRACWYVSPDRRVTHWRPLPWLPPRLPVRGDCAP